MYGLYCFSYLYILLLMLCIAIHENHCKVMEVINKKKT